MLSTDFTPIFMACIFLLLGLIVLTQFMNRIGHMAGGAGLSITKWVLLTLLGMFLIWGIYNQIGQQSGLWGTVTIDKWIMSFIQTLYTAAANFIQWIIKLLRGGKALLPALLL